MHDFISDIGSDNFIGLVAVVGGLMIPLVAIVGGYVCKHRRLGVEATLKQLMIERGMSADEIRDVLEASIPDKPRRGCSRANSSRGSGRC